MVKRHSEKGSYKPIYHGTTLNNRVDRYLANGDPEIGYGGELSQMLNSPHVRHFINEAAKLKGLEDKKASIPASVYLAIATVALVAAVGGGCIGPGDSTGHNELIQATSLDGGCGNEEGFVYGDAHQVVGSCDFGSDQTREYEVDTFHGKCNIKVELSSKLMNGINETLAMGTSGLDSYLKGDYFDPESDIKTSEDVYRPRLEDPRDDKVMNRIVDQIDKSNSVHSEAERVDTAVRFVQKCIHYDYAQYGGKSPGKHLHPYATLYLNRGVCCEKSVLLAEILRHMGYGVAIVGFKMTDDSHAGVGIKCPPGEGNFGANKEYAYIETTEPLKIGELRSDLIGKDGRVIAIYPNGNTFTGIDELNKMYAPPNLSWVGESTEKDAKLESAAEQIANDDTIDPQLKSELLDAIKNHPESINIG